MATESFLIGGKRVAQARTDLGDWVLRSAIVLSLTGLVYTILSRHFFHPLFHETVSRHWARIAERPSHLWIV
ncbi:MAG TPA: hypothetical protein VFH55_13225, partial [Nitrospiria bacterium]|nr:hypothetical protein [Nitrospiria bacterium]